ncbi:hypothetical protein H257_14218 [Aphanomyces astaci]|uniref:Chromo domain-containing protein n=1 Tax=Aphanomyces astaci TaxID=112090 RepID=W4FRR7_APHAT|nr:hypothetical protein H257_14218 [Aphanomyces astaci]ETV70185.1 hypothetical protein H257_14218 [Aphanomyces astaci]|eukprot:XP_009840281.1 hypothetical protein H257_14218 [Aphanomyces astaci]
MPSDRLSGMAPVTAFTGLSATTPLSAFVNTVTKEVANIDWLNCTRKKHMDELLEAMEQPCIAKWLRQAPRSDAKPSPRPQVSRQDNKLSLHLRGPSKIVRVVTYYVMETQQLVQPNNLSLHHGCRLKMYCKGGHEVTEDLADHIPFGNEGFHVAKLGEVPQENGEYQALVYWLGLDEDQASCEPVRSLYEDIPIGFRCWVHQHEDEEEVKKMVAELQPTDTPFRGEVFCMALQKDL